MPKTVQRKYFQGLRNFGDNIQALRNLPIILCLIDSLLRNSTFGFVTGIAMSKTHHPLGEAGVSESILLTVTLIMGALRATQAELVSSNIKFIDMNKKRKTNII